ncbi:MAG: hypothetical protein WA294_15505 [Acidobacteriaceae bacterium]
MTRFQSLTTQWLVTLLMIDGALSTNLHAQSDDAITISVPFPFTVGTQKLAPGTYQFSLPIGHFLLSVRNVKTGEGTLLNVHPEQQRAVDQYGSVVFRYFDGRSALNEIHFPGEAQFSELVERHAARKMAARKSSPDKSITVAQR